MLQSFKIVNIEQLETKLLQKVFQDRAPSEHFDTVVEKSH